MADRYPDVILITAGSNLGFARANNLALPSVSGRYIVFVNADTVLFPDTIAKLIAIMDADPAIGVIAPQLISAEGSVQFSCRRFPRLRYLALDALFLDAVPLLKRYTGRHEMRDWDHSYDRDVDQPAGAFLMSRRKVINEIGGFDERFRTYYEDVDWCLRVRRAGWRIRYTTSAKCVHFGGGLTQPVYTDAYALMHESLVRYFFKHRGTLAARTANWLSLLSSLTHVIAWSALAVVFKRHRVNAARMEAARALLRQTPWRFRTPNS